MSNVTSAVQAPLALEMTGVNASYGITPVLRDVSLTVPSGATVALIGPNGAGKTTLLKVASGLLKPTSGRVTLHGEDVTAMAVERRVARGLCHVPEGRGVYRSLTVRDNLRIQARRGRERDAVERAVAAFPILAKKMGQIAGTMSGGEQQMLALSAAYVRDPRLVIVDEPSLGLAPVIVDLVFEFLARLAATDTAILAVDQFALRLLAISSRAYVLRRGAVVADESAKSLLDSDVFAHYLGTTEPGTIGPRGQPSTQAPT